MRPPNFGVPLKQFSISTYLNERGCALLAPHRCVCYDYSITALRFYQGLLWRAYWDISESREVEQQGRIGCRVDECFTLSVALSQYGDHPTVISGTLRSPPISFPCEY